MAEEGRSEPGGRKGGSVDLVHGDELRRPKDVGLHRDKQRGCLAEPRRPTAGGGVVDKKRNRRS
jgi:hypothetical protein